MWSIYSLSFIKKNKASSISIMAAALISSVFLSLLCSFFYNMWLYEAEQVIYEEGDWQGSLSGEAIDIARVRNHANVAKAQEEVSPRGTSIINVYFNDVRKIYQDLPQIAKEAGVLPSGVSYHETLLAQYLIFDPLDKQPPLLLLFYLTVLGIMVCSLVLIIHNAFGASMNARVHQFGILGSIGATPGQIRVCLLQEAAALCILPILAGSLMGMGLCSLLIGLSNWIGRDIQRIPAVFAYHGGIYLVTILVSLLTVFLSAWLPAGKVSRISPLDAIRSWEKHQLKRKKHSPFLSTFFGVEGELAGNSLRARRKALRTTTMSLTLSFLAFTLFLCFMTLSTISTKHTYFEHYKDAWDIMATAGNTPLSSMEETDTIRSLTDVDSCVAYQKGEASTILTKEQLSEELNALGGMTNVAGTAVQTTGKGYRVKVQLLIMEDEGFKEYCSQVGITPAVDGAVLLNRIWDSVNSNFRYKEYIPYIKEEGQSKITLQSLEMRASAQIPILGYTSKPPILREEYDNYALVQILPLSLWNRVNVKIGKAEQETFLRILTADDSLMGETTAQIKTILEKHYPVEIENRIHEEITNTKIQKGLMLLVGGLCVLLAFIGIANIFSNTLSFIYQRKREFARYLSIGVTPAGIRKILAIEALVIAGRPLVITLPLTILFVSFMVTASYLNPIEFIEQAPILSVTLYFLFLFLFVGAAYYIGGKKIYNTNLSEALRDDTMV